MTNYPYRGTMSGLLVLPSTYVSVLLLLARVAAGAVLFQHGWMKVRGGAWKQSSQWIGSMGVPAFLAPLVMALEVVGGVFLILGLLVPIVGLLFLLQMAGIMLMKKNKMKATLLPKQQGGLSYEIDYVYMIIALLLVAVGAGSLSLDAALGLF